MISCTTLCFSINKKTGDVVHEFGLCSALLCLFCLEYLREMAWGYLCLLKPTLQFLMVFSNVIRRDSWSLKGKEGIKRSFLACLSWTCISPSWGRIAKSMRAGNHGCRGFSKTNSTAWYVFWLDLLFQLRIGSKVRHRYGITKV
jgi:hypothetical protein